MKILLIWSRLVHLVCTFRLDEVVLKVQSYI